MVRVHCILIEFLCVIRFSYCLITWLRALAGTNVVAIQEFYLPTCVLLWSMLAWSTFVTLGCLHLIVVDIVCIPCPSSFQGLVCFFYAPASIPLLVGSRCFVWTKLYSVYKTYIYIICSVSLPIKTKIPVSSGSQGVDFLPWRMMEASHLSKPNGLFCNMFLELYYKFCRKVTAAVRLI